MAHSLTFVFRGENNTRLFYVIEDMIYEYVNLNIGWRLWTRRLPVRPQQGLWAVFPLSTGYCDGVPNITKTFLLGEKWSVKRYT